MRIRLQPSVLHPFQIATLSLLLGLVGTGCRPAAPVPAIPPRAIEPDAPKGDAIADPALREAREQADSVLDDLLVGKAGPELATVVNKLKDYRSASIKTQRIAREGAADFSGVLSGPGREARFSMHLVRQADGKWAVGVFSGPNPIEE